MIQFEKVGDERPFDILVTTDDRDGELAGLDDCFARAGAEDMEAATNLAAASMDPETDSAAFLIPGAEAGEVADIIGEDFQQLGELLDDLNAQALADLQAKQHRGEA